MNERTPLTEQEENLIKDLLKHIDSRLPVPLKCQLATGCGVSRDEFDTLTDSIFRKLGNGRVTVLPEEDDVRHLGDEHPENWV